MLCFLLTACTKKEAKRFQKIDSSYTNINFRNDLKSTPELNILTYLYYYNGAGVAAADFNNDGLVDLFFSSNQGQDKIYLNKGNFRFIDITETANITNEGNWSTGVTHVDINADGLLDIYVCKAAQYRSLKGRNLLYVNQGPNQDGIPVFKEDAENYGLDFSGLSTQAAFFDYDLDGDLDLFLMNHSVHPNNSYGKGAQRQKFDSRSGDRLYRNDSLNFVDVSQEAGIFQGKIGYGLGLAVSDIDRDGYPDIYVGNDFYENDYLYNNQKNGSFKEVISTDSRKMGHTSHFSMGNDIADVNNDGLVDIVTVDMLPGNLERYKTSGLEFPFSIYNNYLRNGYAPQYMQNTFHLNLGDINFGEVGHLSGISATEWSWSALLADYDNDGFKDLYISNGIKGATNDMDFIKFISNDAIQKGINQGMTQEDLALIDKIPEIKISNYIYRNLGGLRFQEVTEEWTDKEASFSNGCVYADLDNDGDLDIVVNNVNANAFVLENRTNEKPEGNYLKVSFKGKEGNPFGIGAKIMAFREEMPIYQENFITRGYLSAVPPILHLGLGRDTIIDSLKVIWPLGKQQTLMNIRANQTLEVREIDATENLPSTVAGQSRTLENVDNLISYYHKENPTIEFSRDPLVPYAGSNEGPDISVADINNDGLEDIFISGAKNQASVLYVQNSSGSFESFQKTLFAEDAKSEDTSHVFFDANEDGNLDLLVGSGGNEFTSGKPLSPRLYLNTGSTLEKDTLQFAKIEVNVSKIEAIDFDSDGDMDIAIASDQVPREFGKTPEQYLFKNDGLGNFKDVSSTMSEEFRRIGNVKDMVWNDLDSNGYPDLIVVGHWMPVSIFLNDGRTLKLQNKNGLGKSNGWWNTVKVDDFNNDGHMDLVCGNWGLNSKLKASKEKPLTLYNYDFDGNGKIDPIVTYFHGNIETPFASKDELVKQMPYLNKKYLSYKDFAKADMADLFSKEKLEKAEKKKVYELGTVYFENTGKGTFVKKMLPTIVQASTIEDIAVDDFNGDGFTDMLLVGNNFEISTQLGRMDALHGVILQNDRNGGFVWGGKQGFDIPGPARNIDKIRVLEQDFYIIGINNSSPIFLMKKSDEKKDI